MKKIVLVVARDNGCNVKRFDTVTEAYHFYLKNFSTFGDKWYYFWTAHKLLRSVADEAVMESIFQNVFIDTALIKEK